MRHLILVGLAIVLLFSTALRAEPDAPAGYDADLAEKLGADAYGMRRYVMVNLKVGPNRGGTPEEIAEVQRGHMAHITRLAESGTLVMAGPFMDRQEIRGIFIFAVDTVEEAEALTAEDPAVVAGRLVMEARPWYGPAALMQVTEVSRRITRESR